MTETASPLGELARRVESAEGPDGSLDAEIALACGAVVEPARRNGLGAIIEPAWWTMPGRSREVWPHRTTPWPLTSSLDCALALVSEKLPGWKWGVGSSDDDYLANLWPPGHGYFDATARTPALALLAALLKSLETGQ